MISIAQAFSILEAVHFPLKEKEVSLWDARHSVLAKTVYSPINMPPFRQSNMDGFAIAIHDSFEYDVVGEIKAGDSNAFALLPGQAVKIFTGAAVPDSAQAVIEIEKVAIVGSKLLLHEKVLPQTNVRLLGAQIKKDAVALKKGSTLNAAAVGFLAGLGFSSVNVYAKPSIGIVVTGNELIAPGQPLIFGKIYESNAIMLKAALYDAHYDDVHIYEVEDDFENTTAMLRIAIDTYDVVLVSGGISVGDYDFVGKALQRLGVDTLFYGVNQKPGKPLYAGTINNTLIFGLPGNPAASLVCFYIHVSPTLRKLSGMDAAYESKIFRFLTHDYAVDNSRGQFLKATIIDEQVTILPHQESSMLDSFALANTLVYLPHGQYTKVKGEAVLVYML